ncbi:hypothetical protein HRbin01_01105 [archaeon HR01]|nr:hypothetical protein HRbin01_01105 [archaeon HR01]
MNGKRLEKLLSLVLLTGVVASISTLAIGVSLYSITHGLEISLSEEYRVSAPSFYAYLEGLAVMGAGVKSLIAAGLILLMLTPYARVLTSLIYFAAVKDLKFILITAFVFAVLTLSLLTH